MLMHLYRELVSGAQIHSVRHRIRQLILRIRKYKHLIHSFVKFCTCVHRRVNPTLTSVGSNVAIWKEHFLLRRKVKGSIEVGDSLRGASRGMEDSRDIGKLTPGVAGDAKFGSRRIFVAG